MHFLHLVQLAAKQ